MPLRALASAHFHDLGRSCALWLTDAKQNLTRFEGLRGSDFERVSAHLAAHAGGAAGGGGGAGVKLVKRELSSSGRNFGSARVVGGFLHLLDDEGKLIAPVPLSSVGMAPKPAKSELELQCIEDDTVEKDDEVLVEMKLYVPRGANIGDKAAAASSSSSSSSSAAAAAAEGGESASGSESEGGMNKVGTGGDPVYRLHRLISDVADIKGASGVSLVEFPEDICQFLVPRGRFKIELFPTFMRIVGSSAAFTVQYKSITRMAYLPVPTGSSGGHAEATRFAIVVSLDDPVRQGLQRHPHLVMQLEKKAVTAALRIPEVDIKAGKYEGLGADGAESVTGELPKLVASLLKKVSGKAVFKPENFTSHTGQRCVRCSHRAQDGLLFPLEKSMMWIHKPTVFLRYADIEVAEAQRAGTSGAGAARTWDLAVHCRASGAGEKAHEYVFQQIDRSEKDGIVKFLKDRNVNVKAPDESARGAGALAEADEDEGDDDDDEEDEDASVGSDDDDDDDDDSGSGSGSGSGDADEDEGFGRKKGKKAKGGKKEGGKKRKGGDKGKGEPKKKKSKKSKRNDDD